MLKIICGTRYKRDSVDTSQVHDRLLQEISHLDKSINCKLIDDWFIFTNTESQGVQRDSSVSIVTRLRDGRPRFNSLLEQKN
jgi:hypothetical protein